MHGEKCAEVDAEGADLFITNIPDQMGHEDISIEGKLVARNWLNWSARRNTSPAPKTIEKSLVTFSHDAAKV